MYTSPLFDTFDNANVAYVTLVGLVGDGVVMFGLLIMTV